MKTRPTPTYRSAGVRPLRKLLLWVCHCFPATASHAVVDLSLVFRTRPDEKAPDRLPPETLAALRATLATAGVQFQGPQADQRLTELRRMYEPYVHTLASYFRLRIPPWIAQEDWLDDWQASTWERSPINRSRTEKAGGEHF